MKSVERRVTTASTPANGKRVAWVSAVDVKWGWGSTMAIFAKNTRWRWRRGTSSVFIATLIPPNTSATLRIAPIGSVVRVLKTTGCMTATIVSSLYVGCVY